MLDRQREEEKSLKLQREHQGQRRKSRGLEQLLLKDYSSWKTHAGPEKKGEEEGVAEGNHCVTAVRPPIPSLLVPYIASLKELSVTCRNNKGGGKEFGVKLSRGMGGEKVFSLCVFSPDALISVFFFNFFCIPVPGGVIKYIYLNCQ